MPYPVFISYARKSSRNYAQKLHEALGGANGLAFLDSSDIEAGDRFPAVLVDAILGARVVVVFAEELYFQRWYCLRELLIALAPFDTLLTRPGASEQEKTAALAPIIIALPPAGAQPKEMERFPPLLRTTDWLAADNTESLATFVRTRTEEIGVTIGERLDRLGRRATIRNTLLAESLIPPPANLAGMRMFPFNISPSIGKAFFGRADDLWRIHTNLSTLQGEASTAALTGALEGGGGFGKTRLALEYLHRFGPGSYPGGLFWVDADVDDTRLEDQHHAILTLLIPTTPGIATFHENKRNATEELAQALHAMPHEKPVLFIVDNVPEPHSGVPPRPLATWCPAMGKVTLLATSRSRVMGEGSITSLPVDTLSIDAAVEFLTYELPNPACIAKKSWRSIAEWVGNLPLALELLNRTMQSRALSPGELLKRSRSTGPTQELDEQMEALRDKVPVGSLRGITEALSISYDKLRKDESGFIQRVTRLLTRLETRSTDIAAQKNDFIQLAARLLARLSPEPIPLALLDALGPEVSSPEVKSTLTLRSLISPVPSGTVSFFGTRPSGTVPFFGRMHRVLADFLRIKSENPLDELRIVCEALVRVMIPDACRDPKEWPLMNACLPHAKHVFACRDLGAPTAAEAFVNLGLAIGRLFREQGVAQQARFFNEATVQISETLFGEKHPNTLSAMNELAGTLHDLGDLPGARILQEQTLEACRRIFRAEHPNTLIAMNNLAATLRELGALPAARLLQEQTLEAMHRILGDEHPNTLTTMGNLAGTLKALGELPGARVLEEQTLEVSRRILGAEHPDTLTAMSNLAETLQALGDLPGACALNEQTLEGRRRIFGTEHPNTLKAMWNLAETLIALGDLPGARHLQEQTLEAFRRVLGNEHPVILTAMNDLAAKFQALGDLPGSPSKANEAG